MVPFPEGKGEPTPETDILSSGWHGCFPKNKEESQRNKLRIH